MKESMPSIADYAQKYHEKHPDEDVKIFFMPSSVWDVFEYARHYDHAYGEHFYDLSWNHGYSHSRILSDIKVPCVYIHAKESLSLIHISEPTKALPTQVYISAPLLLSRQTGLRDT